MTFPINRKRIASRIAGRRYARELLQLVTEEHRQDTDYMEAIVEEFEKFTRRGVAEPAEGLPPIARLGATMIPFGMHGGKSLDDVPLEYLDWLCREQEGLHGAVRAYLKHPELEGRRRAAGR